ncbi:MAG: hypothetical protein RL684_2838 [Pseudomonadota bacterium]|jgi:hypothetical protein
MPRSSTLLSLAVIPLACLLSGCATIIQGQTEAVNIRSVPDGATLSVTNRAGITVQTGTTPAVVTLKRGAGYFRPESYTITLAKQGYATRTMTVTGTVNGWYFGNIIFGGLIGMVGVDPATGAMYSLPDTVNGNLEPVPAAAAQAQTSQVLTIVSTDLLTAAQLARARRIGTMN